ncbi:MAG: acyl-CoA dehydrogenase [Rhizobiales bacterium]|nr:acyl-CoA dehydrogenase [Hyphomicrobiales bacterium]
MSARPMSALALKNVSTAAFDWRAVLDEIGPELAKEGRRCDENNEFVAANFEILRAREFLALAVPAELGGHGLSRTETAAVLRTLPRYCASTALALAMHTHVTAAAAWRWQHQKAPTDGLLKRIASERIQLVTSGGSDWLASSGKAEKVEGGYRIHARKVFASGAPSAQLFMTGAIADDPQDGPTVLQFGVPMNAKGVSIVETWDTLGMRGTGSHDIVLDGVFVPDAAIAARRKPDVWHPLLHIVALVAFPLVYSVYTGIAEAARDIAVAEARKRRDPAVESVGMLDTELASARIACDSLVAFSETAQPGAETTNTTFIHRSLIARSVLRTVDLAMDVAGGAAYFRKLGLERLFRDVQGARFHPMTDTGQRRFAGRSALGLPIDD